MDKGKKKINYNYAFVFYDVNEKRVQKVFKVCKKYLSHFQFSVFRGDITPSKLIELKNALQKVIDVEEDFICIIKLMNDNVFGEDIIGKRDKATGEDLILWIFTRCKWREVGETLVNIRNFCIFFIEKKYAQFTW